MGKIVPSVASSKVWMISESRKKADLEDSRNAGIALGFITKTIKKFTSLGLQKWAKDNPERKARTDKAYREANSEWFIEYRKNYYLLNKENISEANRAWVLENPEKVSEIQKRYRAKNLDKYNAWQAQRRARLLAATVGPFFTIEDLINRDGNFCHWCSVEMLHGSINRWDARYRTIDHVVPLSKNGPHSMKNCVASCLGCNIRKSDMLPEVWIERFEETVELVKQ